MMTEGAMLPKAELHLHLEGAASPGLVRRLAARHGMTLPADLFDAKGEFAWTNFLHFLKVYDVASTVIKTAQDYRDVTYEYLKACAAEGAIYVELMSSPDHAAAAGLSYQGHLDGIVQGIEDARAETGIESRIIVTCVRHLGAERGVEVAKLAAKHPHPLVTGFGMGGDEAGFPPRLFAQAFRIAHEEAGLACNVHAGEAAGPESVWAALRLPVTRIGHGVRSIEDPTLVRELADRGTVLEVCPTSNIATKVYPDYRAHPLRKLMEAGVKVTLNSDDPPYFATTIGHEYAVAERHFGLDEAALRQMTRTALQAAFVDEPTRAGLLARLDS
ncbi:adenosine deaminase [Inquilinus limosus MP06]|uniref:Adenine deaminase n=2 Tax=Inquilinus limosus TaxID=171674 RepID=A0A0A0D0Z7_9PROT|nr:adenosine deaminase [Inquilinus limosus MP06]